MRHVRNDQIPKLKDVTAIGAAKTALEAIVGAEERIQFIRDNAKEWTAFRHALWGLNGCKCWYSEAILQADQGHIEHYRPKGAVAGESHAGYWWRAFDWTNFRLAHPTVNVRITDYLTGKISGKGAYFPLKEVSARATNEAGEAAEEPVLLDPTRAGDCRLLCFDLTSGKPVPRTTQAQDPWLHRRAADSIHYYHLDEGTWNVQRKDLADEVQRLCNEIERHAAGRPATVHAYEASLDELTRYLGHMAEFSSVALQVLRERGLVDCLYPLPGE